MCLLSCFLSPVFMTPCWLLRTGRGHENQPVKGMVVELNSICIVLSKMDFLEQTKLQIIYRMVGSTHLSPNT